MASRRFSYKFQYIYTLFVRLHVGVETRDSPRRVDRSGPCGPHLDARHGAFERHKLKHTHVLVEKSDREGRQAREKTRATHRVDKRVHRGRVGGRGTRRSGGGIAGGIGTTGDIWAETKISPHIDPEIFEHDLYPGIVDDLYTSRGAEPAFNPQGTYEFDVRVDVLALEGVADWREARGGEVGEVYDMGGGEDLPHSLSQGQGLACGRGGGELFDEGGEIASIVQRVALSQELQYSAVRGGGCKGGSARGSASVGCPIFRMLTIWLLMKLINNQSNNIYRTPRGNQSIE